PGQEAKPEAEPVEEVEEQPKQEEEAESNAEKEEVEAPAETTEGEEIDSVEKDELENGGDESEDTADAEGDEVDTVNEVDKEVEIENDVEADAETEDEVEGKVEEVATEVNEESEPPPKTEATNRSTYVVKSGDTLSKIATAYGTTAAKIASLSGIDQGDPLQIGDKLTVDGEVTSKPKPETKPESKPEATKPETKPKPEVKPEPTPDKNASTYVVKSGDTLATIASAHGTTAQKIASNSGISLDTVLHIGDKLSVNGEAVDNSNNNSSPVVNTDNKTPKPETKPEPTPKPPSNAGFSANQLMSSANSVMGTKYVWGGTTQSGGFDCSGFIHWAYNDAGKEITRT